MNAKPPEERTVFKVVTPLRVKRIRILPDLHVPPDFGVSGHSQPQPIRFPVRRSFARVGRKHLAPVQPMPVPTGNPLPGFVWVSAFGPAPERLPQSLVHLPIRSRRHDVAVVVRPTPNDRVELAYQLRLAESPVLANQPSGLAQEGVR